MTDKGDILSWDKVHMRIGLVKITEQVEKNVLVSGHSPSDEGYRRRHRVEAETIALAAGYGLSIHNYYHGMVEYYLDARLKKGEVVEINYGNVIDLRDEEVL